MGTSCSLSMDEAGSLGPATSRCRPPVPPSTTTHTGPLPLPLLSTERHDSPRNGAPAAPTGPKPLSLNAVLNATIRRELKRRELQRNAPLGPVRLMGSDNTSLGPVSVHAPSGEAAHVKLKEPRVDHPPRPIGNPLQQRIWSSGSHDDDEPEASAYRIGLDAMGPLSSSHNAPFPFEDAFGDGTDL